METATVVRTRRTVSSDPERQCRGKTRFDTRWLARKVRHGMPDRQTVSVYICQHCYGYHLGHYRRLSAAELAGRAVALAIKIWRREYEPVRDDRAD